MGSEIEIVEQRLKSFTGQLQTESGILERLVYKHKNQHRRCSYFQYILKVRRDLKLLKLANLEEILEASFLVINGNRPKQKVQLLESLKRRRCSGGKYNFLEKLLGVTRLTSQMVEPLLKAAIIYNPETSSIIISREISQLLARSFFMKFSLTVLAVLARIRVLIQQMLLDAVLLYNTVSSLSQKHQTVKLNQEGCEVFREYYPRKEEAPILLECIWQMDKYMLVERTRKSETADQEKDQVDLSRSPPKILYENIEVLLGVDESGTIAAEHPSAEPMNVEENHSNSGVNRDEKTVKEVSDTAEASPANTNSLTNSSIGTAFETNSKKLVEVDDSCITRTPERNVSLEAGLSTRSTASHHSYSSKKETKKKVAFVAVKPPPPSTAKESSFDMKGMEKKNGEGKEEDPFFHLLTGGNKSCLL